MGDTREIKTRLSFDGEAEYKAACKGINSTLKVLNSEMKLVTAEYKGNEKSAEALRAKQEVLKKTYDEQARKIKETEAALEKCRKSTSETSEETKRLETHLNHQRAALINTEKELEDIGEKAEKAGHKFSDLGSVLDGLGGAMAKGVTVIGTAAAAIGTAVVAGLAYTVSQADEAKGALNDFCASTGTATEEADQYKKVMENIYNGNYGEGFEDIAASMATVKQQAGDLGADELEKMTTNALTCVIRLKWT